jgi:hypothetical protein
MSMKHWLNGTDRDKPKYANKVLCPYYFIHNKSNTDWPVNESDLIGKKPAANSVSHCTAFRMCTVS